jgi:predicted tellurium resistance membrane protein TerC
VFLILFDFFKVEPANQDKILKYGIFGAVLLRGLFSGVGALALSQYHQIILGFAAFLAYSSYSIVFSKEEEEEEEDLSNNFIVSLAKKYLKTTDKLDGDK